MLSPSLRRLVVAGVVACASAPAFAIDIPITNGSFENTSANNQFGVTVTSWTNGFLQDDPSNNIAFANSVGAFSSFAGLGPIAGGRFVVLNNLGSGTVSFASPVIQLGSQFMINGNFSYITNDPLSVATRDAFDLQIDYYQDAAGLIQLLPSQSFRLSDKMQPIGSSPQSGGGAFGATVFRTAQGWQSFNIFINQYTNMFARFTFSVTDTGTEDGGTNTGVSGVLLDNIFINPEPGTMALFALGGLGLGGIAWRRRKLAAKKA